MQIQKTTTSYNFDNNTRINVLLINNTPWFSAREVCKAIGIVNHRDAVRKLDDDEKGVGLTDTLGGEQDSTIISESGLYTLILRCRDAVTPGTIPYRFRKWVTGEVLPSIRKTGAYIHQQQELLPPEACSTLNARDARRGKKVTDKRAAERIAEVCVPVIMKEMRDHQYHYSNCDVGPEQVIPALLSDARQGLQLRALLAELAYNNHDVSGAYRELEAMRHYLLDQRKLLNDIATHSGYISQMAGK